MTRRANWWKRLLAAGVVALLSTAASAYCAEIDDAQFNALLKRLNAAEASERDAAEQALIEAGREAADEKAFLARLPRVGDALPAEVAMRLERIRKTLEQVEAEAAVGPSRLSLALKEVPLQEALDAVAKQTGNKLIDYREQFGQQPRPILVSLAASDAEFWPTIDKLLDDANLSPYPYSGEEGLGIVERPEQELRRSGRAAYAGPFRLEATSVHSQRGLRVPEESNLRLVMEVSWEPRLAPIALSLDAAGVRAVADDGRDVPLATEQQVIDVELAAGNYASEITLPLVLPARSATALAAVTGRMTALTPGKIAEFKFDKLAEAAGVEQQTGGVTVILDRMRKNGELWEVHMRLRVAGPETGLESHRGWVYNNLTYLENAEGQEIEHVGFETVVQTEDEIGFAYLFEIEGDVADYKWVYKTPAAIVTVPIEFRLQDIPLP